MAGLIFDDYIVDEMIYKNNSKFNIEEHDQIDMNVRFAAKINIHDDIAVVSLKSYAEESDNKPYSFLIRIVGFFKYNEKEADDIEFEEFLKTNAIAILFPYLRGLVSELTNRSNFYPSYTIPVMNITKLLLDDESIEIVNE